MASPNASGGIATNGTTATGSPVVNLPTTVAAGDTLFVAIRVSAGGSVTWPNADWHELWDSTADASDDVFACAWKKATGAEGGTTITLTTTSGKFAAVAWRATGAADPDVSPPEAGTVATGTSTSPNPPAVTPSGGSADYLFSVVGSWEGEQTSPPGTFPANYSINQVGANSGTAGATATNCRVAVGHRQLTGTTDNPGNFGISVSDDWMVNTIAVYPAPPTVALAGTGRHGGALSRALSLVLSYLVGPGRHGPARGTGQLTQRLALQGASRHLPAIGLGILTFASTGAALQGTSRQGPAVGTAQVTQRLALSGVSRQGPALGTGQLTQQLALQGMSRQGVGRSRALGLVLSYQTAPGRHPPARGIGDLTVSGGGGVALQGISRHGPAVGRAELDLTYDQAQGRHGPAIGRGVLTQHLALTGISRQGPALGRGLLTPTGVTALAGTSRHPPALGTGQLTQRLALVGIGCHPPPRGTGLLVQRLALAGIGRQGPAVGSALLTARLALAGIGRHGPARGAGDVNFPGPIQWVGVHLVGLSTSAGTITLLAPRGSALAAFDARAPDLVNFTSD